MNTQNLRVGLQAPYFSSVNIPRKYGLGFGSLTVRLWISLSSSLSLREICPGIRIERGQSQEATCRLYMHTKPHNLNIYGKRGISYRGRQIHTKEFHCAEWCDCRQAMIEMKIRMRLQIMEFSLFSRWIRLVRACIPTKHFPRLQRIFFFLCVRDSLIIQNYQQVCDIIFLESIFSLWLRG